MRFNALALTASAIILGACSGGNDAKSDSTPAPAPAGAPAGTATFAPITGTTHTVNMLGDEKGYRFDPVTIRIKPGDGIKFVSISGPPHNVAFNPDSIPNDLEPQLMANMQGATGLEGPMLPTVGESYTVSFGNVKPGQYPVHCTPHTPMGMFGKVIVE